MGDDYDDRIIEYLLVAGFITGFVVITLCLSIYYICCYRPKASSRRKAQKIQRQQQHHQPPAAAVVTSVDSTADLHQTDTHSRTGDVTAQEFPSHISLIMEYDVRFAPPPYYANEEDLPPPYSIIDAPAEIMTEKPTTRNY